MRKFKLQIQRDENNHWCWVLYNDDWTFDCCSDVAFEDYDDLEIDVRKKLKVQL